MNCVEIFLKLTKYFSAGDLFGMFEDVLYCRLHFEMMTSYGPGPGDPIEMCPPLHSPSGEQQHFLGKM